MDSTCQCGSGPSAVHMAKSEVVNRRGGTLAALSFPIPAQQSKTDQQISLRRRSSSTTSSRIGSGTWARCHRHSARPAVSASPGGAAARAALIAYAAAQRARATSPDGEDVDTSTPAGSLVFAVMSAPAQMELEIECG
jgi:hypothetical protein